MTRLSCWAIALLLACSSRDAVAQGRSAFPPVLASGLDSLVAGSVPGAVRIWTATWTTSADSGKEEVLLAAFEQMRATGGKVNGYDWIKTTTLGSTIRTTYFVLRYERLPVFARFHLYQPLVNGPWVITGIHFHTDGDKVFPKALLENGS